MVRGRVHTRRGGEDGGRGEEGKRGRGEEKKRGGGEARDDEIFICYYYYYYYNYFLLLLLLLLLFFISFFFVTMAQRFRSNEAEHLFFNRIVNIWNSLPAQIVNSITIEAFKKKLDKHLTSVHQIEYFTDM